jgi:putative drug exporter of the RND superfamily
VLTALGSWIARHPRMVVLLWLIAVTAGFAGAAGDLGGQGLFDRLHSGVPTVPGNGSTAQDLLDRTAPTSATVYLVLDQVDPDDPAVGDAIGTAATDLAAVPGVAAVRHPYLAADPRADPATAALLSADGRAVLVTVDLSRNDDEAAVDTLRARVRDRLARVGDEIPGSRTLLGSEAGLVEAVTDQVPVDLRTGESIALPVSLAVMVLVFGGLLAAGLPLVGAIASIGGALASLLGFTYLMDLDASVVNVVTVLGLGLCIDYGLLMSSRYREELRARPEGEDPALRRRIALERTLATAGRTVTFSAVTVAISSAGLLLFRADLLRAVGAAAVSVVLIALFVALTLVPALLALAGERLIRPGITHRVPGLRTLAVRFGDIAPAEGRFSQLAAGMQRRPGLVVLIVLGLLGLAALPVTGARLVNSGSGLLPVDAPQRQLFDTLTERFPKAATPTVLVVARAPAAQVRPWAEGSVRAMPGVSSVTEVHEQTQDGVSVSVFGVRPQGEVTSAQARSVLAGVRTARPGFDVYATGRTAYVVDFVDDLFRSAPAAIGLVVAATFILLFLMTGSVLVPVKALVMNVVSLGATFGMLVWVFQDGHLASVLGFTPTGGIETMIPAITLAFGFGLAMDYEVFLLSRIKELHEAGAGNDEAVRRGLQASGRIITSAALIIVIVFAGFAGGQLLVIKEMGMALAIAVAVDATLVRMLLVPATMSLLGEWNWWAPGPLQRLHDRIGIREHPADGQPSAG